MTASTMSTLRRNCQNVIDVAFNVGDFQFQGRYNGKDSCDHRTDLLSVLARARAQNVVGCLALGGSVEDSEMGVQWLLALRRLRVSPPFSRESLVTPPDSILPALGCTVGVHPTNSKQLLTGDHEIDTDALVRLARCAESAAAHGVLAAIGEIGLDDVRDRYCPPRLQRGVFDAQLQALTAAALKGFAAAGDVGRRPALLLHLRGDDATADDFFRILADHKGSYSGGVVHSFTGSAAVAARVVAAGFYVGVDGITPREAEGLGALLTVPLARIVVETDAPWCGIRPSNEGYKAVVAAEGGKVPGALQAALKPYAEVPKERHQPLPIDNAVAAAAAEAVSRTASSCAVDGVSLSEALSVFDPAKRSGRGKLGEREADLRGIVESEEVCGDEAVQRILKEGVAATRDALRSGATKCVKGRVEPVHVNAVVELLHQLHPEAKALDIGELRAILMNNALEVLGLQP